MARTLGTSAAVSGSADAAPPPHAVRVQRPGWRDPRLWIGIAIVAACIVAGTRILGAADETVPVWAVRADAGAGAVLTSADLETHRVHFAADRDLAGYYPVGASLPARLALTRAVGAGELLPRAAVASGPSSDTVQVPLAVDPAQVPPAVTSGSVVDVYVVSAAGASGASEEGAAAGRGGGGTGAGSTVGAVAPAAPALSAVTVVAAPRTDDVLGADTSKRQLTLAVPEKRAQQLFALLGASADPVVTVVLRPAG